jgi:GT2 family glycosyltransferase/O-antigen/teichoic acid export membrane protein
MRLGAGVVSRLSEHVRTPLHRDAYALALSSGSTAAAGLAYWIVAASEYRPHALGLNAALISSMMFLAGVASLNLPNIVVRFLPEAGGRTRRLVACSYGAAAGLSLVAAIVFLAGVEAWAPRLGFLRDDPALQLWFVLSTVGWCVFAIQDSVLTALGRAVWVPAENTAFSLLKLGLLVALAAWFPLYGIFVSWTIAMLLAVVVVNVLAFGRLAGRSVAAGPSVRLRDRAFMRYFAADYLCSVAWLSAANLMPVIITAHAGATTNAYYALAWAVALPLYALAANVGTSLVLHATLDPSSLAALTRKAARQGAQLLLPVVAGVVVLAPLLLSLFGGEYAAHSAGLLRLLAAAAIPYFVLMLVLSAARVLRRLRPAVAAMGAQAVLALGLVTPLLDRFGVTGAGIAWLASQSLAAAGVLAGLARGRRRRSRPPAAARQPGEAPRAPAAVTVVIPTRDRTSTLSACLDSVLAGERAPDEVIVVDNAPERPATAALMRERYGADPRIRRIPLSAPNAARARGVALAAARGDVVAFVDDDVVVDRRWLAEITSAFTVTEDVGAVTTRILPRELETPAQRWLEQFGGFSKGAQRRVFDLGEHRSPDPIYPYSPGVYGSGASMAFRTRLLRELGGLDPRLSFGGEDLDLFLKVVLAGHRLVYEPRAIAWHRHPREYAALRRTMFHYGAGLTALLTKWSLSDGRVARDIALRLPSAVKLALSPGSRKNAGKLPGYPRELTRLERAGMLAGPFMFARSCWRERRYGR